MPEAISLLWRLPWRCIESTGNLAKYIFCVCLLILVAPAALCSLLHSNRIHHQQVSTFPLFFLQRHDSSFHSKPNLLPLPHRSNALFTRAGQRQRRKKRGIPADSIPSRSNPPPISSSPSPANPTRRFSTSCACSATRPTRFGRFFSTESTISTPTP